MADEWQDPWLRVQLALRCLLTEPWPDAAWRVLRHEVPRLLAIREQLRRSRRFN